MYARRIVRSLGLTIAALVLTGCGTMQAYPGKRLPKDQTALIKNGFAGNAEVIAVDGEHLGFSETQAEMLPGSHSILGRVSVYHGTGGTAGGYYTFSPVLELELIAQAGHTYELYGKNTGEGFFRSPTGMILWIRDKTTDTEVVRESVSPN